MRSDQKIFGGKYCCVECFRFLSCGVICFFSGLVLAGLTIKCLLWLFKHGINAYMIWRNVKHHACGGHMDWYLKVEQYFAGNPQKHSTWNFFSVSSFFPETCSQMQFHISSIFMRNLENTSRHHAANSEIPQFLTELFRQLLRLDLGMNVYIEWVKILCRSKSPVKRTADGHEDCGRHNTKCVCPKIPHPLILSHPTKVKICILKGFF